MGRISSAITNSKHNYGKRIIKGPKDKIKIAPDLTVMIFSEIRIQKPFNSIVLTFTFIA